MTEATENSLAYLVIREGAKWTDVFRLIPGRTVTIGRTSTNQIVIKDERASRNHAEIFHTGGRWTLRDLNSRNGTIVGTQSIRGDYVLEPGDVVRIGHTQFAFVYDLSKAFAGHDISLPHVGDETVVGEFVSGLSDSQILDPFEPTMITHRRGQTKFLERGKNEEVTTGKAGQAATQLCRLAFSLANQSDVSVVANLALDGLFEGTPVNAGAILLDRTKSSPPDPNGLELIAARSNTPSPYHRVSDFLAGMVLRDGEAVLAQNVQGDSNLGIRDSRGEFHATSVICAPIRQGKQVVGLVHLYSTESDRTLDADDLEFTLAVAENVALALKNLETHQELSENLSLSRSEIQQLRKQLGVESEIVGVD